MSNFESKMQTFSEIGDHLKPSTERIDFIKNMERKAERTCVGRRILYFNSIVAALVIVLFPVCGYAAYNCQTFFAKYFTDKETEMLEKMVNIEPLSVKNENYCLTVEGTMIDEDVKQVIVSIEALNEKSWETLKEITGKGAWGPELLTNLDVDATARPLEEMDKEGEQKYYFLYEMRARNVEECDVFFAPVEKENQPLLYMNMKKYHVVPEEYLCMTVPLSSDKTIAETSVTIRPTQCYLNKDVSVEQIVISRLGISILSSSVEKEKILYAIDEKDSVATKNALGIKAAEIIAELKDGSKVCLLSQLDTKLSQEIDWMMEISEISRNNCLTYRENAITKTITIHLDYEFTKVLDTEQIVKVWIDGVEYQVQR